MPDNSENLEIITNNDAIWAIIIRATFHKEGIEFFTPDSFSQQIGYMSHKAGHNIQPHHHKSAMREITDTQEVLLIKYGKLRVDFYEANNEVFKSIFLYKGDLILLAKGGHGFHVEEDTAMIEIKQGPYLGINDKNKFEI